MNSLPFNGFDLALVVILIVGIYRGRKQGMSLELLPLVKWLLIVFVCAVAYEPIGSFFSGTMSLFSMLSCYLIAYTGAALIIVMLFAGLKRGLGGKLLGSDMFGRAEYYLGMGSGLVRFACILLAGLALLNARLYSTEEVRAEEKFQNDVYGSHFFPTLYGVQSAVFEHSLTGPWIRDNLGFFLIKPTQPQDTSLHQKEAKWQ